MSGSPPDPVDLRALEPPEPLVRVLASLEADPAGPHRFLFDREPLPLYALLRREGWRHEVRDDERGFELTVFRDVNKP